MTVEFNCKSIFWYFLHIFCCKKFPNDNDIHQNDRIGDSRIYRMFFRHGSNDQFKGEKKNVGKDRNKKIDQNTIDSIDPVNLKKESIPRFEIESITTKGSNICSPNDYYLGNKDSVFLEELHDENLKYPVNYSDDDDSSISDVQSFQSYKKDFEESESWKSDIKVMSYSVEDSQSFSKKAMSISLPNILKDTNINVVQEFIEQESEMELIKSAKLEKLVECLFNVILCDEIKENKVEFAMIKNEKNRQLSLSDEMGFQSTSFIEPKKEVFENCNNEQLQWSSALKPEDLWEFNEADLEESLEMLEDPVYSNNTSEEDYYIDDSPNKPLINELKQFLPKIRWLIPLEPLQLETHIHSAILHFFQAKQVSEVPIKECLILASKMLPSTFTDNMSVVTEAEVTRTVEDPAYQRIFIDKRIIIHLVKEAFADIYSYQMYFNQKPWIHSSHMIRKNNYTKWKDDKPPESFDLVSKIIWERIRQLFNKKDIYFRDSIIKNQKNFNYSKIIKWCLKRQKDSVDILLLKDLLKEENEWIYFDDTEEQIKIQISEDIFHFLITDTMSWFKTNLS